MKELRVENIVGKKGKTGLATTTCPNYKKCIDNPCHHQVLNSGLCGKGLTLKAFFTKIIALAANVDQDQGAQNVQSSPRSTYTFM